jgi:hypothetical protein
MVATSLLLSTKNKCPQSVNNFWPGVMENRSAVQQHYVMIELIAPFLAIMVLTTSLLCPNHECQQRVNRFWHCILENARAVQ